jgi:hypothetical protein
MIYSSHPSFDKEMGKFLAKHHQDDGWATKLQNVLTSHYEKKIPLGNNISPPMGEYDEYKFFKVYMVVGGISKNKRPRVCFAKKEETIIFLCFGTHIDNYNTKELFLLGKKRLKKFIGED